MERFWVVSQHLENISGVEMFEGLSCLGDWDWAKEAENIKSVSDVGLALLARHEHSNPRTVLNTCSGGDNPPNLRIGLRELFNNKHGL